MSRTAGEYQREEAEEALAQERAAARDESVSEAELAKLEAGPWWHYPPDRPVKGP